MRSMSVAIQDLPYREAHFMFLGEAPRNVREQRRLGEEKSARVIASLGLWPRARIVGATCATSCALVRPE
jgi:hypothetical protein